MQQSSMRRCARLGEVCTPPTWAASTCRRFARGRSRSRASRSSRLRPIRSVSEPGARDGRIGYRVVDEYPETSTYVCHPASSVSPLSLGELIALMERASEGGSIIFPILAMNSRYSTQAELATFITVTSDFYPDLGGYYRALTDAWLEERAREKSDES